MAHTHIGNAGDFLKHTILATAATEVARRFGAVCYIDPYCGESLFGRPTVFRPPTGHPKLAAFRAAEPAIDEWYFGSPVVACGLCPELGSPCSSRTATRTRSAPQKPHLTRTSGRGRYPALRRRSLPTSARRSPSSTCAGFLSQYRRPRTFCCWIRPIQSAITPHYARRFGFAATPRQQFCFSHGERERGGLVG